MTRELVFHLGDHKTGSTSIQATLRSKNWTGGGVGISFPVRNLYHAEISTALQPQVLPNVRERILKGLAERVSEQQEEVCVISSESFEDVMPEAMQEALQIYFPAYAQSARFIAYVRPHADRIVSSFAELLKLGQQERSMDAYFQHVFEQGRFHYFPRFIQWRRVFGSQFELRPMIRSNLYQNCVVRDFMSFALNSTDFSLKAEPEANETVGVEDLAALGLLHRQLAGSKVSRHSVSAIGRNFGILLQSLARQSATKLAMDKALYERVAEAYRDDAEELDEAFFTGQPMTGALKAYGAKTVPAPQSLSAEDHFSADEIRMMQCWSGLVQQMSTIAPDLWARHFTALRTGRGTESWLEIQVADPDATEAPMLRAKRNGPGGKGPGSRQRDRPNRQHPGKGAGQGRRNQQGGD